MLIVHWKNFEIFIIQSYFMILETTNYDEID